MGRGRKPGIPKPFRLQVEYELASPMRRAQTIALFAALCAKPGTAEVESVDSESEVLMGPTLRLEEALQGNDEGIRLPLSGH
jgi:hypothetical protein